MQIVKSYNFSFAADILAMDYLTWIANNQKAPDGSKLMDSSTFELKEEERIQLQQCYLKNDDGIMALSGGLGMKSGPLVNQNGAGVACETLMDVKKEILEDGFNSIGTDSTATTDHSYHDGRSEVRYEPDATRSNSQKPFKCGECGKGLANKQGLLYHNRTHTGEKPFKCPICSASFTQKINMTQHVKRVHDKIGVEFQCKICRKRCGSNAGLTQHSLSHSGETLKCGQPLTDF